MKLNLGCGSRKFEGFLNVDKYGAPDVVCDLEVFPWPWEDSSVEEVKLIHVLEHLGRTPEVFIGIMKELYRVCANGAKVEIVVPHPRHDHFLGDPTHVRAITVDVMMLFDKKRCLQWQAQGAANSPLALYHDVDFETVVYLQLPDEPYYSLVQQGKMSEAQLKDLARTSNNVISEIHLTLKVRK